MLLKVQSLNKSFKENQVLKEINFELRKGEITCIIGNSGAGKTTLLRCIAGLEKCDSGTIEIDGMYLCKDKDGRSIYHSSKELHSIRKNLGMVFQNFNLFPHMSALQNVWEALVNTSDISRKDAEKKGMELLTAMGLSDRVNAYPFQLSGGEKQRVAIARACALNPKIMCFDEPTSALDPGLREEVASIIEDLSKNNMSLLIITHDMALAKRVGHRILFMEKGEIIKEGTKEEFFRDVTDERIHGFISNG